MKKYEKEELIFLTLTSIQCLLPFTAAWLIRNYIFDPTYQRLTIACSVAVLAFIYLYAHH
ncbi:hypothetical protein [Mergibacter septicus]|uniref:hypothetical protein n=1 Tax=Mergibacter septicus TaxID=221402 RepID=UPI0022404CA1|nr:hypothetical protein [Mergibacter septicus]